MNETQEITSDALETLNESQRKQWEASGEWPLTGPEPSETETETPAAEASSAAPVEVEEPLGEPVTEPEAPAPTKGKANRLDERIATIRSDISVYEDSIRKLGGVPPRFEPKTGDAQSQVDHVTRHRYDLQKQLTRMLKDGAVARVESASAVPLPTAPRQTPAAAPVPSDKPRFQTFLDKIGTDPAISDWAAAQEAFADARDVWNRTQWERQQQTAQLQHEAQTVQQTYATRREAFLPEHPDFDAVIQPLITHPLASSPTGQALGEFLQRSEVGPQLAYVKTAELQRLLTLSVPHALYELGKLEASLTAGGSLTPASTPAKPVVSISTAPPPPPQISARPGTPLDDADAALGRGDFAAYQRAMNAREVAARR